MYHMPKLRWLAFHQHKKKSANSAAEKPRQVQESGKFKLYNSYLRSGCKDISANHLNELASLY